MHLLSFVAVLTLLIFSEAYPQSRQARQSPDKRARYLDTYVVKNTEVHYHNADENARFAHKLSSHNGGPILSQYQVQRDEIPLNANQIPQTYQQNYLIGGLGQQYVGGNPPPINFEEGGNQGASAVAQSCEGAICINLRSGLEQL